MHENTKEYVIYQKILLIGESGVGKTCIFNRYAMERFTKTSETKLESIILKFYKWRKIIYITYHLIFL